jgi:carbon monoxide dehydrogenase subunit G
MELEHTFTVAAPVEQAWQVLLDLERIAPCMPGATLTSYEGDEFAGNVRVKIGPVLMTFAGTGRFVERDEQARRLVIEASGKDKRGGGSARAAIRASLRGEGASTTVDVHTDLSVTGRAAQFGRGMIADVSTRLLGQFTDCLAGKLTGSAPAQESAAPLTAAAAGAEAAPATASSAAGAPAAAEASAPAAVPAPGAAVTTAAAPAEPIDLLAVTGMGRAIRRAVPYVLTFLAGAVIGGGIVALLLR